MNEFISKSLTFIKNNILISILIGAGIIFLFFGRQVKRLLFGRPRVRHRRVTTLPVRRRRRTIGRPLPRSVGMHKARRQLTKSGKVKKPWQIKGSNAARLHMRKIRQQRGRL